MEYSNETKSASTKADRMINSAYLDDEGLPAVIYHPKPSRFQFLQTLLDLASPQNRVSTRTILERWLDGVG